jgi:hypothetical protein
MDADDGEAKRIERWQRHLLPFMIRMLLGLTLFFLVVSLGQIAYLHWRIEQSPPIDLRQPIAFIEKTGARSLSEATETSHQWMMVLLEANALDRRYHQASVVLMARVWTSYLGFVTGMTLALVGAVFILGRVQGTFTSLEAKVGDSGGALKTTAPGIVLACLGTLLMMATLFVRYQITVTDAAIYSRPQGQLSEQPPSEKPNISFPAPAPTQTK